jgi:uncharacterized protein (TIGR03437 family)
VRRMSSFFVKSITVLSLGLGAVAGLFAQPALKVTISGTLGQVLGGSGGVVSGTYVSGLSAATGTSGGFCTISISGTGGSGGTAEVTFISTNTLNTVLTMETPGSGYSLSSPPTTATLTGSGGGASCGTAGAPVTITSKVDDPLGLSGVPFTATTSLNPVGVTYNATSVTYTGLDISFSAGPLTLPCNGAQGVLTLNDGTDGGNDTFTVSKCNFVSIIDAAFTAKIAFVPGTIPAPLPLAFSAGLVTSPATASQGTYTVTSGTDTGVATVLAISGSVTTVCSDCPAVSMNPASLNFTAQAGGAAPPSQTTVVSSTPTENEPFAITTTATGGSWLTAKVGSALGGQIGATVTVSVNPAGLAANTYNGTVNIYAPASTSPVTVPVTFTVSPASFTLNPTPTSFTFNSVNGISPAAQSLGVASSTGSAVSFSATPTSTGNWLSVNPTSSTTPATLQVSANAASVPAGVNAGTIALAATGCTGCPTVNVTLNETTIPSQTPLSFSGTVGGSNPTPQTLTVTATAGPNQSYTATATSTGNWLSVSSGTFTTNAAGPSVSVNINGLTANTYTGTINVAVGGTTIPVSVTLKLTSLPSLQSNLSSLTFAYNPASPPASQTLTITSSIPATPISYNVTTTGGSWLSATPASGATQGTETVSVSGTGLATGTYNGTVVFTCQPTTSCGNTNGILTVPVTLTVTATLNASPTSMTFSFTTGGTTPAQTLSVTSNGAPLTFTAVANGVSGTTTWLSVTSPTGATPQSLSVAVAPGTLAAGIYNGSVVLTCQPTSACSNTGGQVTVGVTLTVSSGPLLTTNPASLAFSYTVGGTVPGSQMVTVGSNGTSQFTGVSAVTSTPWLSVSQSGTTTPLTLTVSLVSAQLSGLPVGLNNGTITITAAGAGNSPLKYTVALTVLAQPTLSVSPSSFTFNGTVGGANPANQTLNVNGANGTIGFTAVANSSGTWLSVTPASGSTNASLQVSVNTTGLAANTYNGSITVTSTTTGTTGGPFIIPVTLVMSNNSLNSTPTSLTFTYTLGGSAPAAQTLNVGSAIAGLSFTAAPGASWVAVTPTSGTTPQSVSVSIVTAGLTAQTYNSSIVISAAGVTPLTVPVKLTVNAEPSLLVTPTTLSFTYLTGGAAPTGQTVAVSTSSGASTPFSVSAVTATGGPWLQVPTGGTAPGSFLASIVTTGLTAGTYTGTITVSETAYISATVGVTLVVTQPKAVIQITGNTGFTLSSTSPPATSTLAISASDGSAQAFTVAIGASQYNWLSVSPTSGTSPANVTLTANPAGLIPGIYTNTITVTMPNLPIPTLTVTAQLTVTGSNLVAKPSTLTFTYQPGAAFPPAQTVALTTITGGTVPLASVTSNVQWLQVSSASSAPATLTVSVNPGLLTTGTYLGAVVVKGVGATIASLEIPVTITVNAASTLTVTPATLTFNYQTGAALPPAQTFAVASGNVPVSYTVSGPAFVTVSPSNGTTPGTVTVTANPSGLAAGTYSGTVNVVGSASNTAMVAVSLTITSAPGLTVAPSQLSFKSPVGGPAPAPQTLTVTSSGAALGFTAAASAAWLGVTPTTGNTPATLAVSVNPTGLVEGTYTGAINITPTGSATGTMVAVTLQVGNIVTPAITITGVINAASGAATTVAPGMAISIFGTALGPQTPVTFTLPAAGGTVATTLGGTQVLFDGTAVPIIYTSSTQVNAMVPFELASKASTVLTVSFNGQTSAGMTLPVVAAEPGLFTANASGTGEGAILNQDGSVNSASNPAAAGSVIQLFGTGAGLTIPASIDGGFNPITTTGALVMVTTSTVGGETASVYYAGPAPSLLAGVFQVDVTLPSDVASGNIPVVVTMSCPTSSATTCATASSQANVTVAVQ